ncbi:MAG: hypothetical protein ACXVY6_16315 [Gaiellaceae bacterium]
MVTAVESLSDRIDRLIESHKEEPLLSTTGTRAAIGALIWWTTGLEEAIRELAHEIQSREDAEEPMSAEAPSGRLSRSAVRARGVDR